MQRVRTWRIEDRRRDLRFGRRGGSLPQCPPGRVVSWSRARRVEHRQQAASRVESGRARLASDADATSRSSHSHVGSLAFSGRCGATARFMTPPASPSRRRRGCVAPRSRPNFRPKPSRARRSSARGRVGVAGHGPSEIALIPARRGRLGCYVLGECARLAASFAVGSPRLRWRRWCCSPRATRSTAAVT